MKFYAEMKYYRAIDTLDELSEHSDFYSARDQLWEMKRILRKYYYDDFIKDGNDIDSFYAYVGKMRWGCSERSDKENAEIVEIAYRDLMEIYDRMSGD